MTKTRVTKNNLISIKTAKQLYDKDSDIDTVKILEKLIDRIEKEIKEADVDQKYYNIEITKSELNIFVTALSRAFSMEN